MANASFSDKETQDAACWAEQSSSLQVFRVPTGALNLNVEGRQVVGPLQGFGQLWQKTYRISIPSATMTPGEVMRIWKKNFSSFLPSKQRFYPVMDSFEPGQVVLINASLIGMPVSTGVMVLYADDESFTLMTPQGHPESGWNTFSAFSEDDCTVCQIQSLARANDPIYELGFCLLGTGVQERIWIHVLEALAAHMSVKQQVQVSKVCIDPQLQWSEVKNIWQNAAIRTVLYTLTTPVRWFIRWFMRGTLK